MNFATISALCAVLSCVAAKWMLSWRVLQMRRDVALAQADYRAARKDMGIAVNQRKFLEQEERRLKARIVSVKNNLASYKKSFEELAEKEKQEQIAKEKQKALLKNPVKAG